MRLMPPHSIPIPNLLQQIPTPPEQLFHAGAPLGDLLARPRVAIVGSRMVTPYGKQITTELAGKLAEHGIVIISGLALGVDGLAHQAALDVGGLTIAVLPTPLDTIAPPTHWRLAKRILDQGGALLSEYAPGEQSYKYNFVNRNRLVSGLADVLLITEAATKSGSLHTAEFALQQGREVMAVPGNITSRTSAGTNNLIKQGATPVTSCIDVLHALGLESNQTNQKVRGRNENEQTVLDLLQKGTQDGEKLLAQSKLSVSVFNQILTMLEITGKIRPLGANQWSIY
ncbi:MAG: hypothetical protein JWL89_248 [Candidatus Saccharibacteria bacterium]|nr:hypothetical protein [Candidatus Saccharibacteria bacterium]